MEQEEQRKIVGKIDLNRHCISLATVLFGSNWGSSVANEICRGLKREVLKKSRRKVTWSKEVMQQGGLVEVRSCWREGFLVEN